MIRSRLTSVQRIEAAKDLIDDRNILKSVLSDDIDKLQATLEEIDQDSFDKAIDMIMSAKNIYIFADVYKRQRYASWRPCGRSSIYLPSPVSPARDTCAGRIGSPSTSRRASSSRTAASGSLPLTVTL